MKQLSKLLVILLMACSTMASGQTKQIKKGDEFYRLNRFADAIPLYEQALEKKSNTAVQMKLANCFRFLNKTKKAEALYAEIVQNERVNDKMYLYYGESLMSNGKYEEAKKWFLKYSEARPEDEMGAFLARACEEVKFIKPYFPDLEVKEYTQNSEFDDTAPVFANGSLVFSSDRQQGGKLLKQKSSMTGRDFIRVYASHQNPDGTFEPAEPLSNKINELNKNTGPITFSGDGKLAIFSCNAKEPNKQEVYPLQLYSATTEDGEKWGDVELLSINRPTANFMHPALSPDGKMLFYVSDKGKSIGGTDIFVCYMEEDGWGKPENLGPFINTVANEGFPFYSADGKLYFSSKGHIGFGGYDIFFTEMDDKGRWKKPTNIGQPINSPADDISIFIFEGEENGFFTSSREGGDDDIFIFETAKKKIQTEPALTFLDMPDTASDKKETMAVTDEKASDPMTQQEVVSEAPVYSTEKMAAKEPAKDPTAAKDNPATPAPIKPKVKETVIEEPAYQIASKETAKDAEAIMTENEEFGDEIFTEELVDTEEVPITEVTAAKTEQMVYEEAEEPVEEEAEMKFEIIEAIPDTKVAVEGSPLTNETEAIEPQDLPEIEPTEVADKSASNNTINLEQSKVATTRTNESPSNQISTPRTGAGKPIADPEIEIAPEEPVVYEPEKIIIAPKTVEQVVSADEGNIPSANNIEINSYDELRFALSENRVSNGQVFKLPSIRFPFDQFEYTITPTISKELDNLAEILRSFPNLRVEIGGYTESYGEDSVNLMLSRERAEAARDYLIEHGIEAGRLVARGYGETSPLNHCVNGVLCSREQHLQNQRLEMKILRQ